MSAPHPIKIRRKALGLTQGDVAKRAHLDVGTISAIEIGHRIPRTSTMAKILKALRVGRRFTRDYFPIRERAER